MTLPEKIRANTLEFLRSFETLKQEDLELHLLENNWSILEIAEHVFMINRSVLKIIANPVPSGAIENNSKELFGEQKINHLLVTKRDRKVPAPDFSFPKGRFTNIIDTVKNINSVSEDILNYMDNNAILNETQTIKHPILGEMTKMDWLNFMISHTNRHRLQIEDIKEKTGNLQGT